MDEYQCESGNQCIPKNFQCDGRFDCQDKSDEVIIDLIDFFTFYHSFYLFGSDWLFKTNNRTDTKSNNRYG